jgi:hypothetical protein
MTNKLDNWTPAIVNRTANENGWEASEFDRGYLIDFTQSTKLASYRVMVHYTRRCGVFYAALHVLPKGEDRWRGGAWTILEGRVPNKREAVIRWLAGDFDAASEYRR